jgi:putrescine transport system ATP-binding protein
VQPSSGRIMLDDTELASLPPHRRPVNTMFQSYALFPHMSVATNIGFGLRQQGRPRAEIAERVAEMLALVRLEGFAGRRPHQLSGGQQQRVALARCLAPNPRLLLLDEPLSALDRNLRIETRGELARLQRRLGTSFILVTHDQEEALTLADRIGVMQDGRLAQVGSPAEVYERPNTRFVAEFLGAANILPAVAQADGLLLPDLGVTVRMAAMVAPGPVLLALRPERLRIGATDAPNRLAGVVAERSYAGETLTHSVRLPNDAVLRVTQALHDGLGAVQPAMGETVTLSWQPDACIVLRE